MEEMQKKGKLRSLGVSNFYLEELQELVELATVPVSAVQNWFDPFHQDKQVRTFCQDHGIRYIGYSTLGESIHHIYKCTQRILFRGSIFWRIEELTTYSFLTNFYLICNN